MGVTHVCHRHHGQMQKFRILKDAIVHTPRRAALFQDRSLEVGEVLLWNLCKTSTFQLGYTMRSRCIIPHYLDWYGDEVREFVLFPAGVHDDLDPATGGQDTRPGWASDSYGAICSLKYFFDQIILYPSE